MTFAAPIDYEREYNNRLRVPEWADIAAGWEREAAEYRSSGVRSELGIAYGPDQRQQLDLFYPDQPDATAPLVVFIHGGYWRSFDFRMFSHLAAGPLAHGLSVAVVEYRLCPAVTVLEIIGDVRAACLHLHQYHGLRQVICGHSAGGHLAACMAVTDWAAAGAPADLIAAGLAVSGIFELTPLLSTSINETLRLDAATARSASPILAEPAAGLRFEAWVGTEENSEFLRQSRDLASVWERSGAAMRYVEMPGMNHFTAPTPLADPASPLTAALVALCRP